MMRDASESYLDHTCYLCTFDQKLAYGSGTVIFKVGDTCTGSTSHATGIVKSVTGTPVSGYLVLSLVTGMFQDDEAITGSGPTPGAAVSDGPNDTYTDESGKKTQTPSLTAVACRFTNKEAPPTTSLPDNWSGQHSVVWLPAGTVVAPEQEIVSTVTGFAGTWTVQWPPVYCLDVQGGVDHIEVGLEEAATI